VGQPDETSVSDDIPEKRHTLLLVNPAIRFKHYTARQELCELLGKRSSISPLALPILAAHTPLHYDVRIVDEETGALSFNPTPELVGITTTAASAERAYEIADAFRASGAVVVMGGVYASSRPDEALEHADSVVIGEAEGVWRTFLDDFERGEVRPKYRSDGFCDFATSPIPRWDLVDTERLLLLNVEVSRGCPYDCEFCVVPEMYGRRMRYRDIDNVVAEIESLPLKRILFVDDNLTFNKRYAAELVARLKGRGLSWACQSSIEIAHHDDLLREMAESGCISILVGFESLNAASLEETGKRHNTISEYETVIAKIHAHGIHVFASFMIGFDSDTPDDLDRIFEFILKNNLPFSALSILGVAPGTRVYERMRAEGRLIDIPPRYVNGVLPTMRYNHFSLVEMLDRYYETASRVYDFDNVRKMGLELFSNGAFNHLQEDVGTLEKIKTTAILVKRYLFTRDRAKRTLFRELFAMHRKGIIGINEIVIFLLSMEGFHEFFEKAREYLPEVRAELAVIDPGSYSNPGGEIRGAVRRTS